ncbi:RNA polymerase sigma factor [Arenibaculum pallidiluteum]|uniref:RNA polymerase sigma factor n=1 Tax=Arenibaculum pallidiluteum TaxID=2812559 RepID=UPI001A9632F5|nr:RNA polymerase sigma factor [Arenibaculum pallidiluteum]
MRDSLLLRAFHEHQWELLRFLGRRLGSHSLAADVAHDIYVKLLRTDEHPTVSDGRAYLFGMAANLATDHLRVEARRGEILAEADGFVWHEADELSPERHALARAELAYLERAIAGLPPRCRRVFHLNRYEGKTQPEIAEALGIGLTTVYKDLKTAIDTLVKARRRFRDSDGRDGDGHGKA